jgi:hypothetical protein
MNDARRDHEIATFKLRTQANENGCWDWSGWRAPRKGILDRDQWYGTFAYRRTLTRAHRRSYELFVGPIPDGLTIDHKCRRPCCVNPEHLEPKTLRENILAAGSRATVRAAQTHCKRGHELTPANVRLNSKGSRICIQCKNERERGYYRKTNPEPVVRTHCANGHEMTPANTWSRPGRPNTRVCKACNALRHRKEWKDHGR